MNNTELFNKIMESISEKLSISIEQVYDLMSRQIIFKITDLITPLISMIILSIALKISITYYRNIKKDFDNFELRLYLGIGISSLIVLSIILVLSTITEIKEILNFYIDPEAYIFKEILILIKVGIK